MKKTRIAGALLLAPLFLFAACGAPVQDLSFRANWYAGNTGDEHIVDTFEQLEYSVASSDESAVRIQGTCVVTLKDKKLDFVSGEPRGYELVTSTELTFTDGETQFTDMVTSTVEFLPAGKDLRPMRSEKTASAHSPVNNGNGIHWEENHYTYLVEYDEDLRTAKATLSREGAMPIETEYSNLKRGGLYLDNEEILFALRGLSFTTSFNFRSINPARPEYDKTALVGVSTPTDMTGTFSFEADGATITAENAVRVYLLYQEDNTGLQQTLYYAKAPGSVNLYRNVLLRADIPIAYGIGVLRYDLKKATFSNK